MDKKIKVEIFGVRDVPAGGGCSCGGSCAPTATMGEMYSDFVNFIEKTDVKDKVEVKFVDVFEDDISKYEYVDDLLKEGYSMPLTVINERAWFYGGISNDMFYNKIKDELEKV